MTDAASITKTIVKMAFGPLNLAQNQFKVGDRVVQKEQYFSDAYPNSMYVMDAQLTLPSGEEYVCVVDAELDAEDVLLDFEVGNFDRIETVFYYIPPSTLRLVKTPAVGDCVRLATVGESKGLFRKPAVKAAQWYIVALFDNFGQQYATVADTLHLSDATKYKTVKVHHLFWGDGHVQPYDA